MLSGAAWGLESPIVGPRALGMGGVGVACTDDYVAQYYNPAAFGFFGLGSGPDDERSASDNSNLQRKDWGMGLDVTVGGQVVGKLGSYLNDILGIDIARLEGVGQAGSVDGKTLQDLTKVLAALSTFDQSRDAILVDFNAGFGLRINHFGLGVRTYGQAVGKIQNLDTTHIGIALPAGTSVAAQINNITVPVNTTPGTYAPTALNPTQQARLQAILQQTTGVSAATAQQAVNKIDYSLTQGKVDPALIDGVIAQFNSLVASSGVGSLQFGSNDTSVRLIGLGVAEIPLTYGYSLDEHWSVGGSIKYMLGRVYAIDVPLFSAGSKSTTDYLTDGRNNYSQSTNIGLDLAIMARLPLVQVGLTGRNLNAPKFTGPTVNGVKFPDQYLDPTATAGIAFIPLTTMTLAADLDLMRSASELPGREYQRLAAGFEFDMLRTLALRVGVSKNIAESTDPTLYSAGVGVNLYVMRLDVAGQIARRTVTYDGRDVPEVARVSVALATDW